MKCWNNGCLYWSESENNQCNCYKDVGLCIERQETQLSEKNENILFSNFYDDRCI